MRIILNSSSDMKDKMRTRGVKAFLDLIVMSILMIAPTHGYDIMAQIHKHLHVFLSAGQVYPLFYRLERDGLIETIPSKNTRKKTFALTSKGVRSYREMLREVDQVYQMLARAREIGVEGKNPGNVAFQLRRRIKDRKLDIVSSLSRGSVYLERKR